MSRVSVLTDLVTFGRPIDVLAAIVSDLGWSETPVVVLTADHVLSVLRRFQARELTASDVEAWADLIECREDIDYQPERDEEILEAIYVLANPVLNGLLDEALADQVIGPLLP
ncbi:MULTISPECIES: hypothetical protein [unclassified Mesorhizobium]|uniref:hypothetical protein n=1 Tax=unclassified Mesorhizobium TaxID=325217 RepID=UPI000F75948B|nr:MULTISPECIES: hypothetical protein [unclassified Mesorhizobium]AZO54214.1 hypothetical protein EJ077_12485 [Mesorhizobium sp. M8A.F.Ca.ET.057.01.1.1]RWE49647.1 MAG: hypothetical protein EOS80_00865 [Mesorhizobium sp.]